jgi:hypothetical protein
LSIWSYTLWSRLAGNTLVSYQIFILLLAWAASWGTVVLLQRMGVSRRWSLVWVVLVLPLGGFRYSGSPYLYLEVLCALGLALSWRPPGQRSFRRLAGMGFLLFVMLLVRFGLVVVLGAAIPVVDCFLMVHGSTRISCLRLFREWLIFLGTALLGAGFYFVYLRWTLSPAVAGTIIWPAYHHTWYAYYLNDGIRYPRWANLGYFLGQQSGYAVLLFLGFLQVLRLRKLRPGQAMALVWAVTYGAASVVLFRHQWHYLNNLWLMIPAAALAVASFPRAVKVIAVAGFLFPWGMLLRSVHWEIPAGVEEHPMPDGEILYFSQDNWKRMEAVQAEIARAQKDSGRRGVICFNLISGWHHFYQWPALTRSVWIAPGTLLPEDVEALEHSLDDTAAVVVISGNETRAEPNSWPGLSAQGKIMGLMSDEQSQRFGRRLTERVKIDDQCWVFRVRITGNP